jgi:hypothetical protein
MFRFNHTIKRDDMCRYSSTAIASVFVAVALLILPISAQEVKQKVFGSPEEAMRALAETAQSGERKDVLAVLGPEGEDIISSGDEVADKNTQEQFVKSYQEKVNFVKEKGDRVSVIMGKDNWPFPIPIVRGEAGCLTPRRAGRKC